jgi:hypothetical protein
VFARLKAGFSKLACTVGDEQRFLEVARRIKEGDGLREGAVLDTRPYDSWQAHWDKAKHLSRDVLAYNYVLWEMINDIEGLQRTDTDPRKGFMEHNWDVRAPGENSKKFPL